LEREQNLDDAKLKKGNILRGNTNPTYQKGRRASDVRFSRGEEGENAHRREPFISGGEEKGEQNPQSYKNDCFR